MKCPNCSFLNAVDARFCENCGQPLEHTCPQCGKPVSPTSKFCKNCGANLRPAVVSASPSSAASSADPLQALRHAVPPSLASKILAERERTEGERKLVTTLFADIVGSTSLAERMDPEDWRDVVTGAHRRISEAVYQYEGTIAQLLGDGVLAFFGAPIAHEDDPERAIRAGLAILTSIREHADRFGSTHGLRADDLQIRIGLNTGPVVVGNIGTDLHMEYLAIGDTVNLAARLQSSAEPNTILVSDSTKRLVGTLFDFEDRGRIAIKGKAEPVQVHRVLGECKDAIRTRGIQGLDSPMVGRQREFTTLQKITADLRNDRGALVAILGEAGLGKSRLVAEWRRTASSQSDARPLRWIEGRCLSYDTASPHHLSKGILRGLIGVPASASDPETNRALRNQVDALLGPDANEAYPFLAHLLGLRLEDELEMRVKYLDGPALQMKYIAAYEKLLQATALATPTVIICEDAHWADAASVELGVQVMPIAAEAPLVIVFVMRPDRHAPGWKLITQSHEVAGVGAIELHLAPLSDTDSRQLVKNLLQFEALPESLRQTILSKAEGNPFFVEEVIRMLIDHGGLEQSKGTWHATREIGKMEIPDTLQGVLDARIDQLSDPAKRMLQVAAVIGRRFPVRVLERVFKPEAVTLPSQHLDQDKSSIDALLAELENAQLVRRVDDAERVYFFKHTLTQEEAYQMLLVKRRRELHNLVAQAYEGTYPDRLDEIAPLLAQHYSASGDDPKTLEFSVRAGNAAARVYAHREALAYFTQAIAAARRLGAPAHEQLSQVYLQRGRTLELNSEQDQAVGNYEEMEKLARETQDKNMELAALMAHGTILSIPSTRFNPQQAREMSHEALYLAREMGDLKAEAKILWNLMLLHSRAQMRYAEAIEYGEASLEIARRLGLREQLAYTLNDISLLYYLTGRPDLGEAVGEEARALWKQMNNLPMLADNLSYKAMSHVMVGKFEQAISFSEEAFRISRTIGNLWGEAFSQTFIGPAYLELGRPDMALHSMEEGIRVGENVFPPTQVMTRAALGRLYGELGATGRGIELARLATEKGTEMFPIFMPSAAASLAHVLLLAGNLVEAKQVIRDCVERFNPSDFKRPFFVDVPLVEAEYALTQKDYAQAETSASQAVNTLLESRLKQNLPHALHLKSLALRGLGRQDESFAHLERAKAEAQDTNARWSLWPILLTGSEWAAAVADSARAQALKEQAREIVETLAAHIDRPDLRQSFLDTDRVRRLTAR